MDTFFFIGGLVLSYVATKKVKDIFVMEHDKAFGAFLSITGLIKWLLYYAVRWVRLTPALMMMVWMTNNFNVVFGNGSLKDKIFTKYSTELSGSFKAFTNVENLH